MFTFTGKREMAREIEELKGQIAAMTQQGHVAPARQTWGLGLEQNKAQLDIERFEFEKEKLAAENSRFEAHSARSYAGQVVQALLFLNGAAALAILALIASFAKDSSLKAVLAGLSDPLTLFSHGAGFAILTAVFAYLSQTKWPDGNKLWGETLRIFAMVSATASLLYFLAGISQASSVFGALG